MTNTSEAILAIARDLVREGGPAALSFDAIAARLGRSKQAVLYWYPSKQALLAALYLPWLAAESAAVEEALEGITDRERAIAVFVETVAGFHLADLERFRIVYLAPQMQAQAARPPGGLMPEINATTSRLYAALAARLGGPEARAEAMALHAAVLGLVLMVALAEGVGDPLKHATEVLVPRLAARLGGSVVGSGDTGGSAGRA